ncbi:bacteriocin immunity protein [Pseudomonas mohnii]
MELKATLKEYTASEFQALVDKIWAVDLPKQEHDRLINHFDRIAGHPKGADLLFYPEGVFDSNNSYLVVHQVRAWHQKQGVEAFKPEAVPVAPRPSVPRDPVTRSLAEVQKIAADVAVLDQVVETAFSAFTQRIQQSKRAPLEISALESTIHALEQAQHETLMAVNKFKSHKMRIEFARNDAHRNLTYARSEHAQWQSIAHQMNATDDRYTARLAAINQRHRLLHDEAEALLKALQEQLIRTRTLEGVGPAHAAHRLTASTAFFDKRCDVLLEGGLTPLFLSQQVDLKKAIRSTVAEFTWRNNSGESAGGRERAVVLQFEFSSRADTQVYGLSVPLIELLPLEGQDWQSLAQGKADIEVPFRMYSSVVPAKPGTMFKGLREVRTLSQVYITSAPTGSEASGVRVRAAQHGLKPNSYVFTIDGATPLNVHWTAPVIQDASIAPEAVSTGRLGFVYSLPVPLLEAITEKGEGTSFDDYIVVFPPDSGIEPLYVMFRGRHEYPV